MKKKIEFSVMYYNIINNYPIRVINFTMLFFVFLIRLTASALVVMWKDFKKLKLLLWKNLLIQKRHPIQSFIEILLPAIMAGIMVMFRSWVQPVEFNTVTRFEPFPISVPPLILGYRHG